MWHDLAAEIEEEFASFEGRVEEGSWNKVGLTLRRPSGAGLPGMGGNRIKGRSPESLQKRKVYNRARQRANRDRANKLRRDKRSAKKVQVTKMKLVDKRAYNLAWQRAHAEKRNKKKRERRAERKKAAA